jgi:hypothetical protein
MPLLLLISPAGKDLCVVKGYADSEDGVDRTLNILFVNNIREK